MATTSRTRSTAIVVAGLAAVLFLGAGTAEAQGRGNKGGKAKHAQQVKQVKPQKAGKHMKKVPPGHLPPAGLCRVWYDGVPPGRQPAPTSCAAAERVAARDGARVIYGDRRGERDGSIWSQGGGGRDTGDIRRRDDDRNRREPERDGRSTGSRDRGSRPATGKAIPRTIWPF